MNLFQIGLDIKYQGGAGGGGGGIEGRSANEGCGTGEGSLAKVLSNNFYICYD